uniref:Uncharacterized protein n=2 Tax=Caenorhabditis japonica TaxID=281687 RepID=A0A8R1DI72_CAEJA
MFSASESDSEEKALLTKNTLKVDKGPADPVGTFRFRVEFEIVSTKTVGTRLYLPQVTGYSYPCTNENDSIYWSLTVAGAILLQMVLNGSVSALDLSGPESEPEEGQEKMINVIRREDSVFTAATIHQNLTQRPMNFSHLMPRNNATGEVLRIKGPKSCTSIDIHPTSYLLISRCADAVPRFHDPKNRDGTMVKQLFIGQQAGWGASLKWNPVDAN